MANILSNHCPHCGYATDRTSAVGARSTPSPGDLSLCIACGEWSVFEADLLLRAPADDELVTIAADPNCRRLRGAWAAEFQRPAIS